jgi:hypothetical protein
MPPVPSTAILDGRVPLGGGHFPPFIRLRAWGGRSRTEGFEDVTRTGEAGAGVDIAACPILLLRSSVACGTAVSVWLIPQVSADLCLSRGNCWSSASRGTRHVQDGQVLVGIFPHARRL